MNKEHILERLKMLVELCSETEPDFPDNKILFTGQLITAKELYDRFDTGVSDSENEVPEIMKQANKIWRIRNKIKNGEWDEVQHAEMIDTIEDFLSDTSKFPIISISCSRALLKDLRRNGLRTAMRQIRLRI